MSTLTCCMVYFTHFWLRKIPQDLRVGFFNLVGGFYFVLLVGWFLVGCFANCQNISQMDVHCCSLSPGALSQQSPSLFLLKNCIPESALPSMLLYSIILRHQLFLKFKLMHSKRCIFPCSSVFLRTFPHC